MAKTVGKPHWRLLVRHPDQECDDPAAPAAVDVMLPVALVLDGRAAAPPLVPWCLGCGVELQLLERELVRDWAEDRRNV